MKQYQPRQRIGALAKDIGVSPAHAAREFKRYAGLSPATFRAEHRLRRALRELRAGGRAIDIANRWGYSDQGHLCRAVKSATSKTISELRRSNFFNTDTAAR